MSTSDHNSILKEKQIDTFLILVNEFLDMIKLEDGLDIFSNDSRERPKPVTFCDSNFIANIDQKGRIFLWRMSERKTVVGGYGLVDSSGIDPNEVNLVYDNINSATEELLNNWELLDRWQGFKSGPPRVLWVTP